MDGVEIHKISVIDPGNGQGVPNVISQVPAAVIRLVEQIENATGVDILKSLVGNGRVPDSTVPE